MVQIISGECHVHITDGGIDSNYLQDLPCDLTSNILDPTQHAFLTGSLHRLINVPEVPENDVPAVNIWVYYREAGNQQRWEIRPASAVAIGGGINLSLPQAKHNFIDPVNKKVYPNWWINSGSDYDLLARWQWWDNITYDGRVYTYNLLCPYAELNKSAPTPVGERGFFFPSAKALRDYVGGFRSDWGLTTGLWFNL